MAAKKTGDVLLAAAMALKRTEVRQLSFDPLEAKAACRVGLRRLEKHRAELKRSYPGFSFAELEALPELCDRAGDQRRLVQQAASPRTIAALVSTAAGWRRQLLPAAQILVEAGLVSAAHLAKVLAGNGTSDALRDVKDLGQLLSPHRTKVEAMIGAGALQNANAAADEAIKALGAERTSADEEAAADLRDRYATLIALRHDRLRAALAAVTSYREAAEFAPSLVDGRRPRKPAEAPPTP